jgi:hypothetical protein
VPGPRWETRGRDIPPMDESLAPIRGGGRLGWLGVRGPRRRIRILSCLYRRGLHAAPADPLRPPASRGGARSRLQVLPRQRGILAFRVPSAVPHLHELPRSRGQGSRDPGTPPGERRSGRTHSLDPRASAAGLCVFRSLPSRRRSARLRRLPRRRGVHAGSSSGRAPEHEVVSRLSSQSPENRGGALGADRLHRVPSMRP